MGRRLLDTYARLLTIDTRACVALFAEDAEYVLRLGSQALHLRGREEIARFLAHVPRQICFRAGDCRKIGDHYLGEIHVRFPDLGARLQSIRLRVEQGLIRSLEVLPA
jgi:hypothetical protein